MPTQWAQSRWVPTEKSATRNILIRSRVSMRRHLMTWDVNTKWCVCLRRSKLPKVFIGLCNRKGLPRHSTCWFATQTAESAPSENQLSLLNYVATPHQPDALWVVHLVKRWFWTFMKKEDKSDKGVTIFDVWYLKLESMIQYGKKNTLHVCVTSCPGCATCACGGSSLCLCQRYGSSSCEPNCERSCCWSVFSSWTHANIKHTNYIRALAGNLKTKIRQRGSGFHHYSLGFFFHQSASMQHIGLVWTTVAVS